jgi:L-malate glycosyltransferase
MSILVKQSVDVGNASKRRKSSGLRLPRVLHLLNNFDSGGTERQAVELLKRLDHDRFTVRVAALHNTGPLFREIAARFPPVPEFPLNSFYNANAFRQTLRLRSLLRCERIDILHAHDFYAGWLGIMAAQFTGTRVIASQRHLRLSDRRIHAWGEHLINRLARRVLVNSRAIRDQLLRENRTPAGKIVVIRNGVRLPTEFPGGLPCCNDPRAAHDHLCDELGLSCESLLVGSVANLRAVKGHHFLLEAAARVIRQNNRAHFLLVGDGPLRDELQLQATRLGITQHLHLLGQRADAAQLNVAFDLAVLASLHEGMPNTVMEAMCAGTPVIATAVGGAVELITDGETGWLVPPADAEALAQRITAVLSGKSTGAQVAANGRRFVMANFSMQRMVEAVEQLYDELMREGR